MDHDPTMVRVRGTQMIPNGRQQVSDFLNRENASTSAHSAIPIREGGSYAWASANGPFPALSMQHESSCCDSGTTVRYGGIDAIVMDVERNGERQRRSRRQSFNDRRPSSNHRLAPPPRPSTRNPEDIVRNRDRKLLLIISLRYARAQRTRSGSGGSWDPGPARSFGRRQYIRNNFHRQYRPGLLPTTHGCFAKSTGHAGFDASLSFSPTDTTCISVTVVTTTNSIITVVQQLQISMATGEAPCVSLAV
nr:hypothetical protein CFP56_65196 [Quercus suber]